MRKPCSRNCSKPGWPPGQRSETDDGTHLYRHCGRRKHGRDGTWDPSRAGIPFGAVAIGRNEGDRLKNCMNSLLDASAIIYVNSGSSDNSVPMARGRGVEVVQLDMSVPFTASRARNAGLARLQQVAPELRYVQFVDGDCELTKGWCQQAALFLASHPGDCGCLRAFARTSSRALDL